MRRFGTERFASSEKGKEDGGSVDYRAMFQNLPAKKGHIYPGLMLTRDEFLSRPEFSEAKRFVMIRDLRDTLVSHYFSLKNTHAPDKHGRVEEARNYLKSTDIENGLIYLFERDLERLVAVQRSWLEGDDVVVRYEDLIQNDVAGFEELFTDRLNLPVPRRYIRPAVEACQFENVFGRKLGQKDESAHGRQGLPGDWKNYFTPKVAEAFQKTAGNVLKLGRYESDDSWMSNVPSK